MVMFALSIPAINAILNGTSAGLIIIGYLMIREKRIAEHRACMTGALVTSSLFLISYLAYHYKHGSTHFQGQGWVRALYFSILISHTILAGLVVPFVLMAFSRGIRGEISRHKRIAPWTLGIWLYVSITGVIVYLMLYQLYPGQ